MRFLLSLGLFMLPLVSSANVLSLDDALRATWMACVGIDDDLAELKKMAGINTAVTGIGTAAGVGATVTGFVKTAKDSKAESLEAILQEIDNMTKGATPMTEAEIQLFLSEFNNVYQVGLGDTGDIQAELDKTVAQSKKLGNWRTGLLATGAVTNIAGAVIAGGNKTDGDIRASVDACRAAVSGLRSSIMQARLSGIDVTEAQNIANICGEYEYVDLSKIDTKAKGAQISSAVGAATGVAGTITSAYANSKKIRNGDNKKEKTLNTTSNVLSVGTTMASAAATVFNATQIGAIKKVAAVAEKCTGALK